MRARHQNGWRIGVLVIGLIAVGCKGETSAKAAVDGTMAPIAVSVESARAETIERRVEVTGTLAAWEEGTVSLEVDGRLTQVRADLGTIVRRGEVLARVADQEYVYKRVQSEAELGAATTDFKRIEELLAKDMTTRQQLDEARRRLDVARSTLDLAKKKVADTSLRAPFDGVVAKRLVNLGEYVRIGTPAFQVVRVTPLKLRTDVPERYISDVAVDDEVTVSGEAVPNGVLKGRVARIGPSVATDSRSFPIEAEIDNPGGSVKPGTFVTVSILTRTQSEAITVPESAVTLFAGNPRVFVADGAVARERVIETAGKVLNRVIVAKGLKAGEQVVSTGIDLLSDGRSISVR